MCVCVLDLKHWQISVLKKISNEKLLLIAWIVDTILHCLQIVNVSLKNTASIGNEDLAKTLKLAIIIRFHCATRSCNVGVCLEIFS